MDSRSTDRDVAAWVATWKSAAPRLAAIHAEELRVVDVAAFIESMVDAFDAAARARATRTTSGLADQQRVLSRLRV